MDNILNDLTCPITLDLFEDPISVPCCGKAFSRLPLVQYFERKTNKTCPLCKQNLGDFDVLSAVKNVVLSGLVESVTKNVNKEKISTLPVLCTGYSPLFDLCLRQRRRLREELSSQKWSSMITPIISPTGEILPVTELQVNLENSNFVTKPSLFIAVVDRSGSMGGNPWKQVETALTHIMALSRSNISVKTVIIGYASTAEIINTTGTQVDVNRIIRTMFTGGGTNFNAAFEKIDVVLSKQIDISNITISFLTDGKAGGNRDKLATELTNIINDSQYMGPVSVHSIGFGSGCDKELLEKLRKTGNIEGTFRYADPRDDGDTLCHKLQSLFDVASKSSTVPITFHINPVSTIFFGGDHCLNVQFPISRNGKGVFKHWIINNGVDGTLTINSQLDDDVVIPITVNANPKPLFNKWISTLIDELASELLNLSLQRSGKEKKDCLVFDLHCSLIQQRVEAIILSTQDKILLDRLDFLEKQVNSLRKGLSVEIGKLSDIRFSSQFSTIVTKPKKYKPNIITRPKPLLIKVSKEYPVNYSRNNNGKDRNSLQSAITNNQFNTITPEITNQLELLTYDDVIHHDIDGNTALTLAAFCGQSYTVEKILEKYPTLDVETENNDNETAMTLAIKKRGFWKVMKVLMTVGAIIPSKRKKGLEEFAINHNFTITAQIIANTVDSSTDVNETMTSDYIMFLYEKAQNKELDIDVQSYLNVALAKQMTHLITLLIKKHGAIPTIDMFLDHCIPKKPDSPETSKYIQLAKILLDHNSELINFVNQDDESSLFKASEKGSLPHVKFFIEKGAEIDKPNILGNTPLWIACAKRYPCIIAELIDNGADVNYINLKGNPPIYSICQKGPLKIAEQLLAKGASVTHINKNGDTIVLLCCRNGQPKILELLLNYVEPDFVNWKAHIDGFNAIFAAVEANKPECIKILHEYGISFEQKTDSDNSILPDATPLHLAAYYGRTEATLTLLSLGANIHSLDINGQTPLHLSVIQGHIPVIKYLINNKADITIKDKFGNTASSYCRNRVEIKNILVNPALNSLVNLARGGFAQTEKSACDLLLNRCGALGCLSTKNAIDVIDHDGSTPLMEAIIHSNYRVIKVLLNLGADPTIKNSHGLNSYVWAQWINNPRIIKLLPTNSQLKIKVNQCIARLKKACELSSHNASILFLANKPKDLRTLVSSGINSRMEELVENESEDEGDEDDSSLNLLRCRRQRSKGGRYPPDNDVKEDESNGELSIVEVFEDKNQYASLLWNAKVFTTNVIASGDNLLTPQQLLSICLFTNNSILAKLVNSSKSKSGKIKQFTRCLYGALDTIPEFIGETYIGVNSINRNKFLIGNKISWPIFLSASTLWRVATEHITEFVTSKKQGTVFIVKSKTGRYVGNYSQFSFDAEVIFKPNTEFIVNAWYQGSVIALGQENIREQTFGLKVNENNYMNTYVNTKKSLIIELIEI